MLNEGIALEAGAEPKVPSTPGLLIYQRRPYLERQDPETGEVIHEPRRIPSGTWSARPCVVRPDRTLADGARASGHAGPIYVPSRLRRRSDAAWQGATTHH